MIEKIYFYRKFGTADFVLSEKEKKIIPVRIKNQFLPDNLVYNWSNNIWEKQILFQKKMMKFFQRNL